MARVIPHHVVSLYYYILFLLYFYSPLCCLIILLYFIFIIFLFPIMLCNYIIVTLWVPSVTRHAFLMASTSLILKMFINFIIIANVCLFVFFYIM